MSIGLDTADDERSDVQLAFAKQATRRILLRGVAYQAISWAWPRLGSTKHRDRKEGAASVYGGVASVVWRRKQRRRRLDLLGTFLR